MSTRKCQDNLKSQILVTVVSKMEIDPDWEETNQFGGRDTIFTLLINGEPIAGNE